MDWTDLKDFYNDRLVNYKQFPKEIAELEFNYFTSCINTFFPEAIDNPLLIVSIAKESLIKKLSGDKIEANLMFRRTGEAFSITYDILETFKNLGDLHSRLNSQKEPLTKEQVIFCFAEWLEKQGCNDVSTGLLHPAGYDLTGTYKGVKLFAYGIGTPYSNVNSNDNKEDVKLKFKNKVANTVFTLLDEMIKDPQIHPALLLPDDRTTREMMKNYIMVNRLGITIFWVTSVDDVRDN